MCEQPCPNRSTVVSGGPRGRRDELLTITQAITELGVPRSTFYRWRSLGKGPRSIRLPNGSIRIRRTELEHFVNCCEQ